ncbi:hypothetical protein [Myxococcus phage Mx1]|nr:hypothetical protein [Myxococcus phage Mx1]
MPKKKWSAPEEARQAARRQGRYVKMPECPRCKKRGALEPAYSRADGGVVPNDSPWAGSCVCTACLKELGKE